MPGLARKVLVIAAVEGLILQPLHHKGQRPVKLEYQSGKLSVVDHPTSDDKALALECHGIVGSHPLPKVPTDLH